MPNDWTPIFCGSVFLVIALSFIVLGVIWERARRKEEEPLTTEQAEAVRKQGDALGIAFFATVILGAALWGIAQVFPAFENQIPLIFQPIVFIVYIVAGIYISLSSIRNQVSMFRGRWTGYPKGEEAVSGGIGLLVVIGVILYIAWLKITGQ